MRSIRLLLLLGLCILTSYGCQSTPPSPETPPAAEQTTTAPDTARLIEQARGARDPAEGAALYARAARLQYDAGDRTAARATLARVRGELLGPDAAFDYYYVAARLSLDDGRIDEAYELLGDAIPASGEQQRPHLRLAADVAAARGDYVREATALIDLADLLGRQPRADEDAHARMQALHDAIWAAVSRAPAQRIPDLARGSERPVHQGWWILASSLLQGFDLREQQAALTTWRNNHANHPAAILPPRAIVELAAAPPGPRHIALMLPLTGPLANAGRAVREGFMAGFYFADSDITITVYDTHDDSITALYEDARAAGAELIVGPLDRVSLAELNEMGHLPVPVLGLNYLANDAMPSTGLLQFSMAIEHEARSLASQLRRDGHERVVLLHAGEEWSHRARREFHTHFAANGGTVLDEDFFAAATDITPAVGRVFAVQASRERRDALARLFGVTPEFVPRRRQDIDAVVAFVDGVQARALMAAMVLHFADSVPAYATSQALDAIAPAAYRELDGMRISQIPWRVYSSPMRRQLNDAFPTSRRNDMEALYAFGIDAFRIADRVHTLRNDAYARMMGGTGILQFDAEGRITREPIWAVMRNGNLRVAVSSNGQ
jgi:uncharacterized protein